MKAEQGIDAEKGLIFVQRLATQHHLTAAEYKQFLYLLAADNEASYAVAETLAQEAAKCTLAHYGNGIFLRGLIEISNHCRNNCYYCGIRCNNTHVQRYRLSKEDILACCQHGYHLGLRTFVLQGGEDAALTAKWVEDVVRDIRNAFPQCAITLSLGEWMPTEYKRFFAAGANRYLLRHETANATHYAKLHPPEMSFKERVQCLRALKNIGFQTGAGMMVGSPFQTLECLAEDLIFIEHLRPEMIGIGPFVPQKDTPFNDFPAGSVRRTVQLISILRLMCPHALIPATTALATLSAEGRKQGILAGANVVMPNLSPVSVRQKYCLYDNKAFLGKEAAENIRQLADELRTIGRKIDFGRGDFKG